MSPDFPIPFTKMSGTGNDFIIIDHRRPFLPDREIPGFVRSVCQRGFSVGADGLILIEDDPEADFRWQFFNGDGSRAEMCGNGARCAARFALQKKIAPARMRFITDAGPIEAEVLDGRVKLKMTPPVDLRRNLSVQVDGRKIELDHINTGVPHAVHIVEQDEAVDVAGWGRAIRFHPLFAPAGANVNFVRQLGPSALGVRTYERGVEAETMACGTGAAAAAIIAALQGLVSAPVTVTTSGGARLTIHFSLVNGTGVAGLFLEGPARIVYEGELRAGALEKDG
ncbi:MAG: diaminopimelate epimerase [Desulfobacterales bacterium]|nr:diaminopimelate epimerase [Desulfobacterales bacterium]